MKVFWEAIGEMYGIKGPGGGLLYPLSGNNDPAPPGWPGTSQL